MGLFKKKEKKQSESNRAVLTVYACRKGTDDVAEQMVDILKDTVIEKKDTKDGAEFTLQDGSAFTLHIMNSGEVHGHTAGMAGFFSRAPIASEEVKKAAIQQIMLFNCVVGIEFTVDGSNDRTDYLVVAVYLLAVKLKGFVLHPNMYLYRGDKKLLISADGKTDFEQFSPEADSSILEKDIPEEQADIDRKRRSIEKCKAMGIPYMENLKAAVYESECVIPSKESIVRRLACIFAAAVCSEACNCEPKKAEEMCRGMLEELDKRYSVFDWFSEEEREYVSNPLNYPDKHPKFGWRYEGCAVLLWALGLWELGEPAAICDAGDVGKILWNNDFESLTGKAELRSKDEILDMQDLILRYDWACVEARIKNEKLTAVDGEIVFEWHYALNWLTGAYGITDWDKIQTNT